MMTKTPNFREKFSVIQVGLMRKMGSNRQPVPLFPASAWVKRVTAAARKLSFVPGHWNFSVSENNH